MATAGDDRSSPTTIVALDTTTGQGPITQAAHDRIANSGLVPSLAEDEARLPSLDAAPLRDEQEGRTRIPIAIARNDAHPGIGNTAAVSDEPFRALFESIDEGVSVLEVLVDQSGRPVDYRFLAVNPAHQVISGLGSDVVGKCISEVIPDIDPSVIERIGKVALGGEPVRFEEFIRPLDRWCEAYLSRFGHPGSRTVVTLFRDITERKRREQLQAFLLTVSDALRPIVDPEEIQVLAADLLGEHLQVNQANYGEVWGEQVYISHSYAKGLPPMVGTFHPEDFGKRLIDGHRAGRLQVCANTTNDPLFDEQERKALAAVHVGAYIAVPLVKQGAWVGVLSVLNIQPRDWAPMEIEVVQEVAERTWAAVERTRAERALRRSEQKYRSLFESIDEGVSTIEVLFDEQDKANDYRFLEFNAAHEAMSGVPRDVIGKRGREVIGYIEPSMLERLGQVAVNGQPIRFEEFVSGLGRWFDIYLARDGGSDSRRVISVFNNITERKRQEHLQAFLLTLSDALRPIVNPEQIQVIAADLLGEFLQANQAHYGEVRGELVHVAHSYANGLPPMVGTFHPESFGKRLIEGNRAGRLQICENTTTDPLFDEQERKVLAAANIGAYIAAPLVKEGAWVAVLSVMTIQPRNWTHAEVEAMQEVAERTWAAVERTRAEWALSRSEEKYRSLFESIDEGVATIEVYFDEEDKAIDYKILEINAAHEEMSGMGREVIGKRIRELMPDIPMNLVERVGQVALTGQPIRFEEFVSGLGRWFDIYLARDGGSDSRRIISVSKNITERKRRESHATFLDELSQALGVLHSADELVRATGEALSAYLDVSSCHVIGVELDSGDRPAEARLTALATWERKGFFVPSGAYRAGDYLSEEFLRAARAGEPVVVSDTDTDPRTDRDAYRAVGMRAFVTMPILNDSTWPGLFSVLSREPRDWRLDETSLIGEVGHRVFLLFERVRAEEAVRQSEIRLRESDARLRLAVKSSNVGLWDWNVSDQSIYFSPEWKEQLGYGADELSDRFEEWESRVHPDDKTRVLAHIDNYFRESTATYEDEFRLRHKDGSYRWIYTRAELMRNAAGTPERMAGCHVDVTERKRVEETLRDSAARTNKLQRRLIEVEENERRMIHRELHDRIGQDLAAVKLNIELARSLPTAEVDKRLTAALALVQSAIETSRNLMEELRPPGLDDHGLGVALKIFAATVEDRLPMAVSVRDVDLELRLPPLIEASLFRIAQEAVNNVAKYAKARTVKISFVQKQQEVHLTIADDGSGFEVAQVSQTGGYGLQIMRERAEAIDAELKVDSFPGRGTRIIAILERTA